MHYTSMRKAFSMITAIFVILMMSTVSMLVMSTSGKIVKTTTAQYQHAQASLYAKSYTEYAVMAVTAHNRKTNCLEDIKGIIGNPETGNGYQVDTHIQYIVSDANGGKCSRIYNKALNTNDITSIKTPLTLIIDAYVQYKDPDNNAQWLSVHRRTVQKI